MTREDLARFRALEIDFDAIGLAQGPLPEYFCTPLDAEPVGELGCDGIHFILLPGDERVFCVDPAMGEEGSYVLPVAEDFREFVSFILYCRDANPLSQIHVLDESAFSRLLQEDVESLGELPDLSARKNQALEALAEAFGLRAEAPFQKVRALQAAFDPAVLQFSDEYYDVLGLETPACIEAQPDREPTGREGCAFDLVTVRFEKE
jgi:hypothetical protein